MSSASKSGGPEPRNVDRSGWRASCSDCWWSSICCPHLFGGATESTHNHHQKPGHRRWPPENNGWYWPQHSGLDGTAMPLRRIWIPKRGSPDKRPLGIPTQADRARQTLVRQGVEPEWKAELSPHTYGFRPGRSCWDAIEAIFQRIVFRPRFPLKSILPNALIASVMRRC